MCTQKNQQQPAQFMTEKKIEINNQNKRTNRKNSEHVCINLL